MGDAEKGFTAGNGFRYAPETKANAILFQEVCENLLEKMAELRSVDDKLNLMNPFLSRLGKESSFPFMRLILPQLDNLRDKYGVKDTKLAKMFAEMYFRGDGKSYKRLTLFRDPEFNPSPGQRWQTNGDFPLTVQYMLNNAPGLKMADKTKWTLQQVNQALDDLARATSNAQREEVLRRFRVDFSPMNQKWIIRIILRDLKIGLKKDSVLKRIHPDALDEYSKTTSLRKVCSSFIGRHSSVRSRSNIEVFTSFSPMLATNFRYETAAKIVPSFGGRPFCMDVKLDGERMLCHRDGDKVRWFTRNCKDYTEKYGAILTPYILRGVSAHKCILDGEVVTWDDRAGGMFPFGSNRTFAKEEQRRGAGEGTRWLFFVVFDIVYSEGDPCSQGNERLDEIVRTAAGESQVACPPGTEIKAGNLSALPLEVRRRVLRAVMTEERHRLEIVRSREVRAGDEAKRKKALLDYFDENAIQRGEEGLVVKDLSGHYMVGQKSRQSGLWVKMKPEYSDQTADMDLLILGAGYANGKMRAGLLCKFLLGVAALDSDGSGSSSSSRPTKFWPVARVGTGFTMEQLEELNKRLKGAWKTFDSEPPFEVKKSLKTSGDVTRWIAPEDSICLEIKCMEIVKAPEWLGVGCTMRFPRVKKIRYDKGPEGCLNTIQLAELRARPRASAASSSSLIGNNSSSREFHDHGPLGAGGGRAKKRRRKGNVGRGESRGGHQVSELFTTGGGDSVSVKHRVFVAGEKELEMCVIGTGFSRAPSRADDVINFDAWWGSAGSKRKVGGREKSAGGGGNGGDGGDDNNDAVLTKQDVGDLIRAHGGIMTANPEATTAFIVVGDKMSIQVKNAIAAGKHNVVDYRWILECINRKSYDFPSTQHLRAMSPMIREIFSTTKDEYGDDFTEPTDAASLSQLLLNIPDSFPPPAVAQSDDQLLPAWLSPLTSVDAQDRATMMDGPDFVFSERDRCLVYLDSFPELGSPNPPGVANGDRSNMPSTPEEIPTGVLGSTAQAIRLHGGDVCCSLHAGVTHVVLDPQDTTRSGPIRKRIRELHGRLENKFTIRLVTPEWVWRCIELGRLEPPDEDFISHAGAVNPEAAIQLNVLQQVDDDDGDG